ncbi:MAG: Smr/MutS family protein [Candidatus Pacebacteria bacterium]|nr:Smr/MutS family protein [Candidatus Paceibacterota bacterium]
MNSKKEKKNKYPQTIQAELDLHGLTKEESREEIFDFLSEANSKGYNKIRIITGKGIHSENNQGVLNRYVRSILIEENLEYCEAKINEGGSGAIDVKL